MGKLANGQSEIDTVVLRLPDYGKEITNWSTYKFDQEFLKPTSGWSFSVSDEDTTLTQQLLVPGARVELVIGNNVQCSGFIDKKRVETSTAGTRITVSGRDILGPVVDSTADPKFRFIAGMTVVDVAVAILKPFGITTIYNSDLFNINAITGYGAIEGGPTGATSVAVKQANDEVQADGSIKTTYTTIQNSLKQASTRPDLRALTVQDAKPRAGEGAYAYIERLLRRLGLTLWAMADGSGVVIDVADFTSAVKQSIVHKRTDTTKNNVLNGSVDIDHESQPSCIVAAGFGGGKDTEKSKLRVIMINELTGLDDSGQPLPEILNIKARYKSAKVLPIRKELVPFQRPLGDQKIAKPFFVKDDESKNVAQLEAFTRREMANHQQKALTVSYDVVGHTSDGKHAWCVNMLVNVDDDVLGIHEPLWVLSKSFTKTSAGGTVTSLKLIRPFTLQIAQ